jgi:hypothetical protein
VVAFDLSDDDRRHQLVLDAEPRDRVEYVQGDLTDPKQVDRVTEGITPADQDTITSRPRLLSSADRLAKAECLEDILSLQSSHDQGNTGICSHSAYPTVYSYLLHRQPDEIRLLVSQGQPCRTVKRHDLRLPLGDHWSPRGEAELRGGYPSKAAVSAGT